MKANWKKEGGTYAYILALIGSFPLSVTYLHHSILGDSPAHMVLEELYYLPLFLGAFSFGRRGALLTYLYVSACYLPFFFGNWAPTPISVLGRFLHLAFTGGFTFLVFFFTHRQKRAREEEERERYLAGVGRAAANIVHDLKNYLITVLIYARFIREGKKSIDEGLQAIIDSAQSMQKIADDVMDFARPPALDLKEEDGRRVVESAYASCRAKAGEAGISLRLEVPPNPLPMVLDGLLVQRALVNLVYNALESSPRGQEVLVYLRPAGNGVRIGVRDSGSGMGSQTLKDIFLPFYSRKSEGTGLGMAIVKKVVEAHRGEIRMSSKPGRGTEVVLEFPFARPPEEKTGESGMKPSGDKKSPWKGKDSTSSFSSPWSSCSAT